MIVTNRMLITFAAVATVAIGSGVAIQAALGLA